MEFAVDGFVVARRYVLGRKLGSGGMGTVWLAHDASLDRLCALKIVDPDKANDDEVRKRFLREARATAQIRSAHVVEVFDHGVWDGLPFIAMELLEGEELGARLERVGKLEPEAVYRIVAQVARGLARAHALGIVHRDLKPENVFLVPSDGGETVKVLDFGIAHHVVYSPRDKATQAGAVMGTPCYMSPEQAVGEPTDFRADLWALAVVAFQCLTGKLPFFHDALGGLLNQILHEPIPSIRRANPELPKGAEDFWHRAAERDPARRFQSAHELSDALAEALGIGERLVVPALVPCSEAHSVDWSNESEGAGHAAEFAARPGSDAPVAMNTGKLVTRFRRRGRRSAWTWGVAFAGLSALVALGWFAQATALLRAPAPAAPAALAPLPPAPRQPSRDEDAGIAEPPASIVSSDAGAEPDAAVLAAAPPTVAPPAAARPSPLPSDIPSLERPSAEPPPRRAPVRRRSARPVSGSGTRDYGI